MCPTLGLLSSFSVSERKNKNQNLSPFLEIRQLFLGGFLSLTFIQYEGLCFTAFFSRMAYVWLRLVGGEEFLPAYIRVAFTSSSFG